MINMIIVCIQGVYVGVVLTLMFAGIATLWADVHENKAAKERDAAIRDMERALNTFPIGRCYICKHENDGKCKHGYKCFEWRGISENSEPLTSLFYTDFEEVIDND